VSTHKGKIMSEEQTTYNPIQTEPQIQHPAAVAQGVQAQGVTPVYSQPQQSQAQPPVPVQLQPEPAPQMQSVPQQTPVPQQEPQTDFDAPVPVTITMPGGAPIPQPQVQPIQPVTPERVREVAEHRKTSPFKDAPNFLAGSLVVNDTTYWYREVSDASREWLGAQMERLAAKMGITVEDLVLENFENANPAAVETFDEDIDEIYAAFLYGPTPTIRGVLVKWDAVDGDEQVAPLTLENIKRLGREVTSEIIAQVQRSTNHGTSFESFRAVRRAASARRQ
jgi:hypothetical protein